MNKIVIDDITKEAATHYANTEAELKGFAVGSPQWKAVFKKYLGFAVGTMTVGRNPRKINPRDMNTWPEIFSSQGFAGQVAANYKGKEGEKHSLPEIQERIRSACTALAYMYLNGIYGVKTTTRTSKSGKIEDEEMSELQLRSPGEKGYDEVDNTDIAWNQLALTVIEAAVYEFLLPFFTMSPEDVKAILKNVKIEGEISVPSMAKERTVFEKVIRSRIGNKLKDISFKKLVNQE